MDAAGVRAPASAVGAVVLTGVLAVLLLLLPVPGSDTTLAANLIALATSALAAGCAWWRSARSSGRRRHAWAALAGALTCWAIGESIWTWLQANGQQPFPSVADVAYLGFGPLVCLGLLLMPVGGGSVRRLQGALDGLAASWALLLVSWQTALGATVRAGADDRVVAFAFAVAYPVMDVAVLVLTVLTLARTPTQSARAPLALLAAGLVLITVADSAFVFLTATDGYQPGQSVDIAWNVGFCCLGMAALLDTADGAERRATTTRDAILPAGGLLPYLPFAGALVVAFSIGLTGRATSTGENAAVLGLILLLLARQYLTLRQNARLAARVAAREEELQHLAFHDGLTGLANRSLFRNRLEHAIDLHARDGRPLAVLFLDLDAFKSINDSLGHTTGDQLLVRIAERIRGACRAGDTVARIGGDEFAVLLESGGDGKHAAERIVGALHEPFYLAGRTIEARASIGVVELRGDDGTVAADELLARADTAMYTAKRSPDTLVHRAELG